jgi:hypothetical protein
MKIAISWSIMGTICKAYAQRVYLQWLALYRDLMESQNVNLTLQTELRWLSEDHVVSCIYELEEMLSCFDSLCFWKMIFGAQN